MWYGLDMPRPIIYKMDNGKTWVELNSLLENLRGINLNEFPVGEKIADRIELLILRDKGKNLK